LFSYLMINVAIIIPCFNEEESILKVLAEIDALPVHSSFSITPVVINDCSSDNTLEVLKQSKHIFLDLPVNLGIGGAVQTGFKFAREYNFDIAIQLDGDGQHPPNKIADLITPILSKEADVVIGSRFINKEGFQSTTLRRFGINYFKRLNKTLTGINITDSTSGFRAINKKTLELVCEYYPDEYPEPESLVLFALSGLNIKEYAPSFFCYSVSGETDWMLLQDTWVFFMLRPLYLWAPFSPFFYFWFTCQWLIQDSTSRSKN
jgi:glycosyltransferase involved in cell wall biosynthesis